MHVHEAIDPYLRMPPGSPRWKGQLFLGKSNISVISVLNFPRVSQVASTCCVRLFCALTTARNSPLLTVDSSQVTIMSMKHLKGRHPTLFFSTGSRHNV